MSVRILFGLAVTICAAACTPSPQQARYTVEEYRANDQLRKSQFVRCRNDPGTLGNTPDCINAREAERIEGIGSFRNLPPMNLPPIPARDKSDQ